jgi:DNA anti-recombination protein RmuC
LTIFQQSVKRRMASNIQKLENRIEVLEKIVQQLANTKHNVDKIKNILVAGLAESDDKKIRGIAKTTAGYLK